MKELGVERPDEKLAVVDAWVSLEEGVRVPGVAEGRGQERATVAELEPAAGVLLTPGPCLHPRYLQAS